MRILSLGKNLIVRDYTPEEGRTLLRNGVSTKFNPQYSGIVAEDNIFNRIILNLNNDFLYSDFDVKSITYSAYLRVYQRSDIEKMLKSKNILNRNRMGYGKTLEAIEYCHILNLQRILIICPKIVIQQWVDEIHTWWPDCKLPIYEHVTSFTTPKIDITNYEQLGNRSVLNKARQFVWDLIICDESHHLKNARADRTANVKLLPTLRKMALTGTPILNKPDDMWSQLNWFGSRYSGASYRAFVNRFCILDDFNHNPKGLTPSDNAKSLLSKALDLMTVGGDNYNLTEGKNYINVTLQMTDEQHKLYHDIQKLALDALKEQGITVKNGLDQMVKLQQVTTNLGYAYREKVGENPKFVWLQNWLEDNEDAKVVVYSKFTTTLKAMQDVFGDDELTLYHGDMSDKELAQSKQRFLQDPHCRIFAGTIGKLSVGVDGLQRVCNNVVFLDRDWSPSINDQAESRVDRSGQKGYTNIYTLYMKNSIDFYVEKLTTLKDNDVKELYKWIASWS